MYTYSIIENSNGFKFLIWKGKKIIQKSEYYQDYVDAEYQARTIVALFNGK